MVYAAESCLYTFSNECKAEIASLSQTLHAKGEDPTQSSQDIEKSIVRLATHRPDHLERLCQRT